MLKAPEARIEESDGEVKIVILTKAAREAAK